MNISEELYKSFGELPSRRGRGGVYTYIKWQDVADRMNKIFGIHWSSETVFQDVIEDNVIVRVRVTVKSPELEQDFFQEGFGGALLNDGNEMWDSFKAAYSKALKDACKKWGVALFIKDGVEEKTSVPATPAIPATPVAPVTPATPVTPAPPVIPVSPPTSATPVTPVSSPTSATPVTPPQVPTNDAVKKAIEEAMNTPTVSTVKAPPAIPNVAPQMPSIPSPSLPPGVPQIVEESIVLQQEAPPAPVMEPPSTPVTPEVTAAEVAPSIPPTPKAAPQAPATPVQTPTATPEVAATPAAPVAEALPSRPANVPLSPTERVKKMKESQETTKQMPTVPAPNNNIDTQPSNPGTPTEAGINNVQKVAIEGLLDMKGLKYDDITPKALGLTEGPPPEIESLNYAEAIKVIRYVNDLYK